MITKGYNQRLGASSNDCELYLCKVAKMLKDKNIFFDYKDYHFQTMEEP